MFKFFNVQMLKFSNVLKGNVKYQMLNVNKVKLLSERTSRFLQVIFSLTEVTPAFGNVHCVYISSYKLPHTVTSKDSGVIKQVFTTWKGESLEDQCFP